MHDLPVQLITWLNQYGSVALFFLLALGILALPIPDETLIVTAGFLIAQGKLPLIPTVLAAYAGSMVGITVSYVIGRFAGVYLLHKHGRWFGITEEKLQKAHNWFERFGKWLLFFGYFMPGVRHFTGYAAGMSELGHKTFGIFAYSGAFFWASSLLTLGYFVGDRWDYIHELFMKYWDESVIIFAIAIVIYITYRFLKMKKKRPR